MPVTYFACSPEKKKFGETHDIEFCVFKCDEQCYSPQLMTAIWWTNQRNPHKGKYCSATSLPGCVRRLKAERTVPYAEQFSGLYAAFRGTITHTVIEAAHDAKLPSGKSLADYGVLSEFSMKIGFCLTEGHAGFWIDPDSDVDDLATYAQMSCPKCEAEGVAPKDQPTIILGGTLDGGIPVFAAFDRDEFGTFPIVVDEDGTAHYKLDDLKTFKEYAVKIFIKGDPKANPKTLLHPTIKTDYVRQARVYAYLAEICTPPVELQKRGIKRVKFVTSNIQGFAMGEAPYTGSGIIRWRDDYRNPLKDWPLYPIDLGTKAETEAYIRERAKPILDTFILDKGRAPICDEEQSWLCEGYCAFFGSHVCPNPKLERLLLDAGVDPETAFQRASKEPAHIPEPPVAPLDKWDTKNMDAFFAVQRGEVPVEIEAKPRKTAAKKSTKKVEESPAEEVKPKRPRQKKAA